MALDCKCIMKIAQWIMVPLFSYFLIRNIPDTFLIRKSKLILSIIPPWVFYVNISILVFYSNT